MQAYIFSTPDPHAQLQSFEPVQPAYSFPIHPPAFATQQHPDPQMPKPRSRVGEISNPYLQRRVTLGPTSSIPGHSTELRQSAGSRTPNLKRRLKPLGDLAAAGGPQTFFRNTSDSMCLSSERSATNRFNRLVSSYRSLSE